jgi:hypothetical protein
MLQNSMANADIVSGNAFLTSQINVYSGTGPPGPEGSLPSVLTTDLSGSLVVAGLEGAPNSFLRVSKIANLTNDFGTDGQYLATDGDNILWVNDPTQNWAEYVALTDVTMDTYKLLSPDNAFIQVADAFNDMILDNRAPGLVGGGGIFLKPYNYVAIGSAVDSNSIVKVQQITNLTGGFGTSNQYLTSDGAKIVWANLPAPPANLTGNASPVAGDVGNTSFTTAVAGVTATSIVIATVTKPDQPADQLVWLVNTTSGPGTITFNMASIITPASQLVISWFVSQL